MPRKNSISIAIISAIFISALALVLTLQAKAANGPTHWGPDYFPNVPLITQDGKTVHFYDDLLKDKIVAIDLIYTHCQDQCPLETARMAQVQRMLGDRVGKDIFFYSITIDPKRDTPEVLKAYAERYHVGPGWLFLTGKPEDIALISKKIGLYSDPDPSDRDGHTAELMIGDVAAGSWMRNSATDNPRFLATMIGEFLSGYKNRRPQGVQTVSAPQPLHLKSSGEYLFATRCAACHTIGHGDKIGPDLLGVTNIREHAWLVHFIQKPDDLLSANDPVATALFAKYNRITMPNLRLGPDDVIAVVNYLQAETADYGKTVSVSGQARSPVQEPANTNR